MKVNVGHGDEFIRAVEVRNVGAAKQRTTKVALWEYEAMII